MNAEFFNAIEDIEREKGIPREYMFDKINQAMMAAFRKDNPEAADNVVIDMNEEKYAELLRLVREVFGAIRKEELPEIEPINAFIGVYLRLEALLKLDEKALVLNDIESFFGNMEKLTGTLWENRSIHGSLDHGFASYAAVAMMKALE